MKQLILASQSPRRAEILQKAGYQFVPFPVHVSEIPNKNLNLNEQILDIAGRKAGAVHRQLQDLGPVAAENIILAADTMVCIDSEALGKPENPIVAAAYLRRLAGRAHQVKTAIYLIDCGNGKTLSHIETTEVYFREISEQQIQEYIATGEPMDKAGAYAIQGGGRAFVERYEGDFDNVVGLPLHALEKLFTLNSWQFRKLPQGR